MKHLYITRLSEFGTNDLIITNTRGNVIDFLRHACKGIDVQLSLDHILYEGRVYSLSTPARRRGLNDKIRLHKDVYLVPVKGIDVDSIANCLSDQEPHGARAREFIKRHFKLEDI